jgi:hypothetical protein
MAKKDESSKTTKRKDKAKAKVGKAQAAETPSSNAIGAAAEALAGAVGGAVGALAGAVAGAVEKAADTVVHAGEAATGGHAPAKAHGRPATVDTSLPATREELIALHGDARRRRAAAPLGSDAYREAADDIGRIEIRIAAIERDQVPPRV